MNTHESHIEVSGWKLRGWSSGAQQTKLLIVSCSFISYKAYVAVDAITRTKIILL